MADILLIEPRTGENDVCYAPLGLLALAAVLEKEFEVKILDQRLSSKSQFLDLLLDELKKAPVLVGITSITGSQIYYGLDITRLVKEHSPETPVVWGGVHPSFLPEQTVAHPNIDFVVKYEGEQTLLELARALKAHKHDFEKILGLCYKKNGKAVVNPSRPQLDMVELPQPAWHLIDVPQYVAKLSSGPSDQPIDVATARGCPFRCEFCYEIDWSGRTWRGRTAEQVIEEVRMLSDKFGVNHIIFHDDLFIVSNKTKERALEIGKGINSDGYHVKWTVTYRVNQLRRDVPYAAKLVDNGFYEMRAGVESGSPRILKLMKKDLTVEDTLESARITRELGIHVYYSFILGWPGETDEDRQKTIELCYKLLEINPESRVYPLNIYTPYPGSPQWNQAVQEGFDAPSILEEWGEYVWGNVNIPWIDDVAKYENMATLSKFAFFPRNSHEVFGGLLSSELHTHIKFRRLGGWLMRRYARTRMR